MQVEIDVKRMETKFGGRGFSGFGDFGPLSLALKTAKISLRTMGYSSWGSKNRNQLKKFMQVDVDLKCMQIIFGGRGTYGSEDIAHFCLPSNGQNFPSDHVL